MFLNDFSGKVQPHVVPSEGPLVINGVLHRDLSSLRLSFETCAGPCFFCGEGKKKKVQQDLYDLTLFECDRCKRWQPTSVECDVCSRLFSTCFSGDHVSTEDVLKLKYHFCSSTCARTLCDVQFHDKDEGETSPVYKFSSNMTVGGALNSWYTNPVTLDDVVVYAGDVRVDSFSIPVCKFPQPLIFNVSYRDDRHVDRDDRRADRDDPASPKAAIIVEEPVASVSKPKIISSLPRPDFDQQEAPVARRLTIATGKGKEMLYDWLRSLKVASSLTTLINLPSTGCAITSKPLADGTDMFAACIQLVDEHDLEKLISVGYPREYISPGYFWSKSKRTHYFALVHVGESRQVADVECSSFQLEDDTRRYPHGTFAKMMALHRKYCTIDLDTLATAAAVESMDEDDDSGNDNEVEEEEEEEEIVDEKVTTKKKQRKPVGRTSTNTAPRKRNKRKPGNPKTGPAGDFLIQSNLGYKNKTEANDIFHDFKRSENGIANKDWAGVQIRDRYRCVLVCLDSAYKALFDNVPYCVFTPTFYYTDVALVIDCKTLEKRDEVFSRLLPLYDQRDRFVAEVRNVLNELNNAIAGPPPPPPPTRDPPPLMPINDHVAETPSRSVNQNLLSEFDNDPLLAGLNFELSSSPRKSGSDMSIASIPIKFNSRRRL